MTTDHRCRRCGAQRQESDFYQRASGALDLSRCRPCWAEYRRENRGKINEQRRARHAANPEARREWDRANADHQNALRRKRRAAKPELQRAERARWRERHPETYRAMTKRYNDKKKLNANHLLLNRAKVLARTALTNTKRKSRAIQVLLGYSADDLRLHMERQFSFGMGWHNVALWEIDHIIPLDAFSFASAEDDEFRAAWALTNLRPVWAKRNKQKGHKRTLLL